MEAGGHLFLQGFTQALKPREDVTRCPKQGYQWPTKKDLSSQKSCWPSFHRNTNTFLINTRFIQGVTLFAGAIAQFWERDENMKKIEKQ